LKKTKEFILARLGELTYFDQIGEGGQEHSLNKPFSDENTGAMLIDIGIIISLLPPAPARILECGCGTGWLSYFLSRKGYTVVGQDISKTAIELARKNPVFVNEANKITFICSDFEGLNFSNEFDGVIFYEALHHSRNENSAIASAYRALKSNGVFLAFEPGVGHEESSRDVIERYDVGDRDMPPKLIVKHGKKLGFREFRIFLPATRILTSFYVSKAPNKSLISTLKSVPFFNILNFCRHYLFLKQNNGTTWMLK
jgi:SAM-dependent methyltransferase